MPLILRRGALILALYFVAASLLAGQTRQTVRAAGKLELHGAMERELPPNAADWYIVEVSAGEFVRLVAQQMGVHVVVKVVDPRGKTVAEALRPNGGFGPQAASFIGEKAGKYRVLVSLDSGSGGRYRIEIVDAREPTDADRKRVEAEKTGALASQAARGDKREARLHAIELFKSAALAWRPLHDPYEEEYCLGTSANCGTGSRD